MDNLSRRDLLRHGGVGITAALAGCTEGVLIETQTTSDSAGSASDPASQETSRQTTDSSGPSTDPDSSEFSEQTRAKALAVAKDVRKAVVTISGNTGSGGTAWFLDGRAEPEREQRKPGRYPRR